MIRIARIECGADFYSLVEMTVDSGVHLSIDQLKLKYRIGKSLYLHVYGFQNWWMEKYEGGVEATCISKRIRKPQYSD